MMQQFYHGTSPSAWASIQKEGVLWGKRGTPSRCTYLAKTLKSAKKFGSIVLVVWYDPDYGFEHGRCNKWSKGCWQLRVYEPLIDFAFILQHRDET